MKSYYRTLIPDIELKKRFGSPNGATMKAKALEESYAAEREAEEARALRKQAELAFDDLFGKPAASRE